LLGIGSNNTIYVLTTTLIIVDPAAIILLFWMIVRDPHKTLSGSFQYKVGATSQLHERRHTPSSRRRPLPYKLAVNLATQSRTPSPPALLSFLALPILTFPINHYLKRIHISFPSYRVDFRDIDSTRLRPVSGPAFLTTGKHNCRGAIGDPKRSKRVD
jgi:hypothetical protein